MISERARKGLQFSSASAKFNKLHKEDAYDEKTNKEGFIKLSDAENILCKDLIDDKFASIDWGKFHTASLLEYPDCGGESSTLNSIASFLNKFSSSKDIPPISVDNLTIVPGLSAGLDLLSHVLFDSGDFLLTPAPFYYHFQNDFGDRGLVNIELVHSSAALSAVQSFENAFQAVTARKKGEVRSIILANPQNPEGDYYSLDQIGPIIRWALERNLYVIMNEAYDHCIYDEDPKRPFQSAFALFQKEEMPEKFIWVWGMSKNFSLPGIRAAIVHTSNAFIQDALRRLITWYQPNWTTQFVMRQFLDDHDWFKNKYWPENLRRLRRARDRVLRFLDDHAIPYLRPRAGSFVLADFRKFMPKMSIEGEQEMCEKFIRHKVLLTPGDILGTVEPGWFRIAFAGVDEATLNEALKRIGEAICYDGGQNQN